MSGFSAIALAVGGGLAGSALTYALTWLREYRRSMDLFRAPQREAIANLGSPTSRLDRLAYERFKRKGGWLPEEHDRVNKEYQDILAELNHATYVALLTVAQPDVSEQFWKFFAATRALNYIEATSAVFQARQRELSEAFGDLTGAAYGHLSPPQSRGASIRNARTYLEWYNNRKTYEYDYPEPTSAANASVSAVVKPTQSQQPKKQPPRNQQRKRRKRAR
ncbi:hypothetical protein LK468_11440 [Mycobacteroides abscessus]|uniref:hypothetical protein n=1 Tax=Mycobacteroides abscessus TaxID=36809 RepID=UPI001D13B769|nr:hypothetical protein [Mycobacteroides abscessus]UEA48862.1 hypothetical protein LK451_01160 [Mycobacteroides abscessus subsp. abscessus]UEA55332.1 hypothetical protein LK468_11440 [Mycobacteroides abscessus]